MAQQTDWHQLRHWNQSPGMAQRPRGFESVMGHRRAPEALPALTMPSAPHSSPDAAGAQTSRGRVAAPFVWDGCRQGRAWTRWPERSSAFPGEWSGGPGRVCCQHALPFPEQEGHCQPFGQEPTDGFSAKRPKGTRSFLKLRPVDPGTQLCISEPGGPGAVWLSQFPLVQAPWPLFSP